MANKFKKFRGGIDKIDKRISKLLDKRAEIVKKVGKEKKRLGIKIVNKKREKEVLENVLRKGKNKKFIRNCFESIIRESRKIQK